MDAPLSALQGDVAPQFYLLRIKRRKGPTFCRPQANRHDAVTTVRLLEMNKRTIAALCAFMAFGACGPEIDSTEAADGEGGASETPAVNEQGILGLSPSSNVSALYDRHLQNFGAANTCAYRNGKYLNTQTCDAASTGNQVFSIYKVKANGRFMLCSQPSLQRFNWQQTCKRNYYSSTGTLSETKWVLCSLGTNFGDCITTGSGTDVRIAGVTIDANYEEWCIGSIDNQTCWIEQNFYNGRLRWPEPLSRATFALESGKYLKADNGSYLKREATQIVSAKSPLSTTDANFQWGEK